MNNDNELYNETLLKFSKYKYISPAKIQRIMKVSYIKADTILNRLDIENHASPRIGAYPCKLLHGRFRELKSFLFQIEAKIKLIIGYHTDPEEYLQ